MFHPLADRVLIKPEDAGGEKMSPSGLVVIPDLGKTRATIGFVLAVGPDCDEQLEIGDKVLFGKYAGSDIELNHEELVICRLDDVLGIITEEPDEDNVDQGSSEPDPPA
jgi:chaperonin GroES